MTLPNRLLLIGAGYCGQAVARAALATGFSVVAVSRTPERLELPAAIAVARFDHANQAIAEASHVLATAPPLPAGDDPVLARYAAAIATAPRLGWIGYLSSTSVYGASVSGDRRGATVDEQTEPSPASEHGKRRLAAERAWARVAGGRPLDLFRAAAIYGPGRSAFERLRSGNATRILAPGHVFCRIHRDDLARAVLAAMVSPGRALRVFNLADDEPAESAAVLAEAARLLGVPAPPAIPLAEAWPGLSAMAQSFWRESRRVSSRKTRAILGLEWRYPDFRTGLAAILAEELGQR
ncbi:MAG: NAD(P)-binding domain-containing protein [Acetobacteraceae bacterium]